jgi:hypothetical protein
MKKLFRTFSTLLFVFALLFSKTSTALASGEDVDYALEVEVNGYHVALSSQNEWAKGENTVVVTPKDEMGMAVSDAEVEILIAPKSAGHTENDPHAAESRHSSMPGMDMSSPAPAAAAPAHGEEAASPIPMMEMAEHGMYMAETHLESSGEHVVQVMFHVNGEMLTAEFVVSVPGTSLKMIMLWSFVMVNVGIIASAGILKKQTVLVKGGK